MSNSFLSQDEVDALLKGVTGDQDEAPAPESVDGVRSYDLASQERIVRDRMPTMEIINQRFARLLRISLFNLVRRNPEISVGSVKLQNYGDFIRGLVVPTNFNLVQMKPLRGSALFIFDSSLVFLIIDSLFGGNGQFQSRVEARDFTPTEQRIVQMLLNLVFSDLQKSWAPVHPIQFEFVRSEMQAQFASIATPNEVVMVTTLTIEFGSEGGEFHICVPYSAIEPIRDLLCNVLQGEQMEVDKRWVRRLSQQVQAADVEIVINMGHAELSIKQILAMQVGDVIGLDIPQPLLAEVDGVPVMECKCGILHGQYALKVERMLTTGAEQ